MSKKLFEIAAEIVQAQSLIDTVSLDQIENALIKTFSTLQKMQKAEEEGTTLDLLGTIAGIAAAEKSPEEIEPKNSIQEDKVICLECGAHMKQLTAKHLSSHELSIREYKRKWGFPLKQSLSARSLSRERSRAAKKRGLPENLLKYREERRLQKLDAMPRMEEAIKIAPPPVTEEAKPKATARRGRKKSVTE